MNELKHGSPVVEKTAHLLGAIAQAKSGISLGDLVEQLGAARSTVYRILNSLAAHGLVARVNGGATYELGPRFIELARTISPTADRATLVEAARPILHSSADRIRESFKLSAPDGDDMLTIFAAASPAEYAISVRVGMRSPKHVGASGKLSLAYATPEQVADYCSRGLIARTTHTITDPEALGDELRHVRDDGYAEDNMESNQGLRALAAPIFDASGALVAAVSVPFIGDSTPDRKRHIRKEVMDAANALTHILGGVVYPSNKKL